MASRERYTRLYRRIWSDEAFLKLSDQGKLLWFAISTHPHQTALGAMRASAPGLGTDLGWAVKHTGNVLRELEAAGFVDISHIPPIIVLVHFIHDNPPDNRNVIKGWRVPWSELPDGDVKTRLHSRIVELLAGLSDAWLDTFEQVCPVTTGTGAAAAPGKPTRPDPWTEQIERAFVKAWNGQAGLVKVQGETLTQTRRAILRQRLRSEGWRDQCREAIAKFPLAQWPEGSDGWRPTIEWFLRADTVTRILEGEYDRAIAGERSGPPAQLNVREL